jgi:uncharacterized FlaG/YvyC family protein
MNINEIEHSVRHTQGQEVGIVRPSHAVRNGQDSHGEEHFIKDSGVQSESKSMDREAIEKLVAEVQAKMDAGGIDIKLKVRDDSGMVQVEVLNSKDGTVVHKFPPDSLLKLKKEAQAAAGAFLDRTL